MRTALGGLSPAFEIGQQRLPAGAPKGIVVGPTVAVPRELRPSSLVFTRDDDTLLSAEGNDDHYLSLSRLCAMLARFGLGLQPRQRVITGSLMAPSPVAGASSIAATFEDLGDVELATVPTGN